MINVITMLMIAASSAHQLPPGLRFAIERHLPAWANLTGNSADPTGIGERIVVERSDTLKTVFLIDRKLDLLVQERGGRYWVSDARWCDGESWKGRCDDVWSRTDREWNQDTTTFNHKGYDVYLDTFALSNPRWTDPVPSMDSTKRKWTKGACESGLCFLVSKKESSLVRSLVSPEGAILWWEGGYIKDVPNEQELMHGFDLMLKIGHALPYKEPILVNGKRVWYDPSNTPGNALASTSKKASKAASALNRFLADSLDALLALADKTEHLKGAKDLKLKDLESFSGRVQSGKVATSRKVGTNECSGADLKLRRLTDGTHLLLTGDRLTAIQLQDSSLSAFKLDTNLAADEVVKRLGKPLRRDADLLVYEANDAASVPEVDQIHWKIMIQFKNGKIFRATFFRQFDDC